MQLNRKVELQAAVQCYDCAERMSRTMPDGMFFPQLSNGVTKLLVMSHSACGCCRRYWVKGRRSSLKGSAWCRPKLKNRGSASNLMT